MTGSFSAIDRNSGKIVNGFNHVYVGIKGHSGRGGGNTYTLINGTITFSKTNLDGTSTSLICIPSTISLGGSATCTAKVTDLAKGSTSIPTGNISFFATNPFLGSLNKGSCTLLSGSCSVIFKSNQEWGPGTTSLYASYSGDSLHFNSSTRTSVSVTGTD